MQMVMFVLDDPDRLDDVLDAWRGVGVSGVTILETSGLYRRTRPRALGARYAFGLDPARGGIEVGNYTLLAIVPDEAAVRACLEAAESVVGNLDDSHTGVIAAWDLGLVKGVPGTLRNEGTAGT